MSHFTPNRKAIQELVRLCLIALLPNAPSAAPAESAEGCYRKAVEAERFQAYASALRYYTQAIKLDSNFMQAYQARTYLYAHFGDYKEAVKNLSEIIRRNSKEAENYYHRAHFYALLNNHKAAQADLTAAIKRNPKHAPSYWDRANSLAKQGKYKEALKDFNRLIKLEDSADKTSNYYRALALIELKRYKEALKDLQIYLKEGAAPTSPWRTEGAVYFYMARASNALGKTIEAQTLYAVALDKGLWPDAEDQQIEEALQHAEPDALQRLRNRHFSYFQHKRLYEKILETR